MLIYAFTLTCSAEKDMSYRRPGKIMSAIVESGVVYH